MHLVISDTGKACFLNFLKDIYFWITPGKSQERHALWLVFIKASQKLKLGANSKQKGIVIFAIEEIVSCISVE